MPFGDRAGWTLSRNRAVRQSIRHQAHEHEYVHELFHFECDELDLGGL